MASSSARRRSGRQNGWSGTLRKHPNFPTGHRCCRFVSSSVTPADCAPREWPVRCSVPHILLDCESQAEADLSRSLSDDRAVAWVLIEALVHRSNRVMHDGALNDDASIATSRDRHAAQRPATGARLVKSRERLRWLQHGWGRRPRARLRSCPGRTSAARHLINSGGPSSSRWRTQLESAAPSSSAWRRRHGRPDRRGVAGPSGRPADTNMIVPLTPGELRVSPRMNRHDQREAAKTS